MCARVTPARARHLRVSSADGARRCIRGVDRDLEAARRAAPFRVFHDGAGLGTESLRFVCAPAGFGNVLYLVAMLGCVCFLDGCLYCIFLAVYCLLVIHYIWAIFPVK